MSSRQTFKIIARSLDLDNYGNFFFSGMIAVAKIYSETRFYWEKTSFLKSACLNWLIQFGKLLMDIWSHDIVMTSLVNELSMTSMASWWTSLWWERHERWQQRQRKKKTSEMENLIRLLASYTEKALQMTRFEEESNRTLKKNKNSWLSWKTQTAAVGPQFEILGPCKTFLHRTMQDLRTLSGVSSL